MNQFVGEVLNDKDFFLTLLISFLEMATAGLGEAASRLLTEPYGGG